MPLKFGKTPPKFHSKTLRLRDFLSVTAVPPVELKRGWEYKVPDAIWAASMLGNDEVKDCVIAAYLHFLMAACAAAGLAIPHFTKDDAFKIYSAVTGFDPSQTDASGNNPTDNGTAWTDMLNYAQTNEINGEKILAWASFDYTDSKRLNQAIDFFGAALVGTAVSQSMMDQFNAEKPWDAPFDGDNLGGHGIPLLGFGREGRTCITWAKRQQMDLKIPSQFDEAYVVITPSWFAAAQKTPVGGLDMVALQDVLKTLTA